MPMLPLLAAALLAAAVPLLVWALVPARVAAAPVPSADGSGPAADAPSPLRFLATSRGIARIERSLQLANLLPAWTVHRVLRV